MSLNKTEFFTITDDKNCYTKNGDLEKNPKIVKKVNYLNHTKKEQ